jgi:hypothetical protein
MSAARTTRPQRLLLAGPVLLPVAALAARSWWTRPLRRLRRRANGLRMERAFRFVGEDSGNARRYFGLDSPRSLTRSYATSLTVDETVQATRRHLRALGYAVRVEHHDSGVELLVRDAEPEQGGPAQVAVSKDDHRTLVEVTVRDGAG